MITGQTITDAIETFNEAINRLKFDNEEDASLLPHAVELLSALRLRAPKPAADGEVEDYAIRVHTIANHALDPGPARSDLHHAANLLSTLAASNGALRGALADMLSGWIYIRKHHGDLYGVGWDRCQTAAEFALNDQPKETTMQNLTNREVSERKDTPGSWGVEQFTDDGACKLAVFSGPQAEDRAREYAALAGAGGEGEKTKGEEA